MSEVAKKDTDLKLLAGAVLGLAIGLVGLFLDFQAVIKHPSLDGYGVARFG